MYTFSRICCAGSSGSVLLVYGTCTLFHVFIAHDDYLYMTHVQFFHIFVAQDDLAHFYWYMTNVLFFHVFVEQDDLDLHYWYMKHVLFFTYLLRRIILISSIGI